MPIVGLSDLKQKSDANQGTHATVENSSDTLLVQKEIPDSEADAKTEPQAKTSGNSDNPPTTSSGASKQGEGRRSSPRSRPSGWAASPAPFPSARAPPRAPPQAESAGEARTPERPG